MNYIPGFSNHLQQFAKGGRAQFVEEDTYGDAAPIMDTYQPAAVMPAAAMPAAATPAAAPYDLSALAGLDLSGLYGMNFGSNFGGGAMGGIYPDDPNTEFIAAPLSNKGNATSQTGGNAFEVRADQPVRLVDHSTNQVVFEGTGYDAARKATELGQGLSDTLGRKANYSIQTADPTGNYSTVAYEKKNKSTLGEIANAVGTVAPLALMAIPGAGPALFGMTSGAFAASLPAQLAFGALTGAASSGLKGQNILKGAALGGLTAAGGALIPKIPAIGDLGDLARPIGTGIGATVGGLATGQSLKNSLLGGAASGALAYAAPGIQKSLGIGQGPNLSTGGGDTSVSTGANAASGPAPIATVTGNTGFSAPVSFGGGSSSQTKPAADKIAEENLIKVTGGRFGAVSPNVVIPDSALSPEVLRAVNGPEAAPNAIDQTSADENDLIKVTGSLPGATPSINLGSGLSSPVIDKIAQPAETLSPEEILVEARKSFTPPVNVDLSTIPAGALSTVAEPTLTPEEILVKAREAFTPPVNVDLSTTPPGGTTVAEDPLIKVTGRQTTTPPVIVGVETPLPDLPKTNAEAEAEKKKKLGLEEYLRLLALASGLGGGGGSSQPSRYGGSGSGRLNPIFSAKLPAAGGLGTIGATRTPRTLGDVDWLTYGTRPELDFFDYAQPAAAPVTTPVPGNPAGPIMATPAAGMIPAPEQILTPAQLAALEKQRLDQYAYLSQFTPTAEELARNTALYGNNEAADPIMTADEPRPMMAKGGAFAAKRGGASKRTEFAVSGPGTGRSDDIPAVLSDGEYVIDAETVALLGDGSSKAGAKKLDELRVKVRKHKGQKLAKGRFSANAKNPEAYLSGGRV
jgi:hypothetical protein